MQNKQNKHPESIIERKGGKITILRHKRIIGSSEIDKPVPSLGLLEQNGNGVERGSHGRGALGSDQIAAPHHHHIPEAPNHRRGLDILGELEPLGVGGLQIEVEQVVIPRMVHRLKQPPQPPAVAACTRDEVGESRQLGQVGEIRVDRVGTREGRSAGLEVG